MNGFTVRRRGIFVESCDEGVLVRKKQFSKVHLFGEVGPLLRIFFGPLKVKTPLRS
jgi:hypothetical protein